MDMESKKKEIIEKMQTKGMTVTQMAESIQFDPMLLGLYLVQDAYPIPTRIVAKVEAALQ